jgi:hypothetical protein
VSSFDDIERRREANEGAHPYRGDLQDEEGDFAVRIVFLDGVDRTGKRSRSLRRALRYADEERSALLGKGYDRHRVHVAVIDEGDPERGELDWDSV